MTGPHDQEFGWKVCLVIVTGWIAGILLFATLALYFLGHLFGL